MKALSAAISTALDIGQVDRVFRHTSFARSKSLNAKLAKAASFGNSDLEFFTPDDYNGNPLDSPPDFASGAIIPTYGFGTLGVGGIQLFAWDKGEQRVVELVAPHKFANRKTARNLVQYFVDSFREYDRSVRVIE